jgi:hypothetical protein
MDPTITAFAVKFDGLGTDQQRRYRYWSPTDWDFFLQDVSANAPTYPGFIHLQLNMRLLAGGSRVRFTEVFSACRAAGAQFDEHANEIFFQLAGPTRLDLVAEFSSEVALGI